MLLGASSVTPEFVTGAVVAAVAFVGYVGSSRGRSWIKSLFKGQSIQEMAATMADQMASVQAAYAVSESERHRLEARVDALATENADLRKQIAFLGDIVTARADVQKLAEASGKRHDQLMGSLTTLGREIATVSRTVQELTR